MEKMISSNQKKGNKQPKMKKKQPLKVVYITNPIKFKTSASEFRALVQELTGQDADAADMSKFVSADEGVAGGSGGQGTGEPMMKVAEEEEEEESNINHNNYNNNMNAHHALLVHEQLSQGKKIGKSSGDVPQGSDPSSSFGSFGDDIYTPQMVEDFQGLMSSSLWQDQEETNHFDVFKSLGTM